MKRLSITLLLLLTTLVAGAETIELSSPDNRYRVEVFEDDGEPQYRVSFNGRVVVEESKLGVEYNKNFTEGTLLGKELSSSSVDGEWEPVYGERATIKECYNAKIIELQSVKNERIKIQVEFRAYNEGVAFRYNFIGNSYLHITDEYTTFTMPEGTMAHFTERAQTSFELLPLKGWTTESDRPLVCELPDGGFVLLTEAAMVDYVRTKFKLDETKCSTLACSMYGDVDRIAPYNTPWRVIMAAERSIDLIANNDLILNLNPENEIEDPSWIEPGKLMRETSLSTDGAIAVTDFCAEHNLQYMLFDAGWYGPEGSHLSDATTVTLDPARNKDNHSLDLPKAIEYAKSKGIKVLLYVNQRALASQLDEILPTFQKWGVSGIKFGFVQVGSQYWTEWMHEAVKKCAEYKLVIDIHDEYRPTGFSRTYPNLLTQEGIRGNEEFPDATHNVTLPFTRFTQGPGDYTPCYYRRDWSGKGGKGLSTTQCHQLAMAVVYYSPLQSLFWYDKPSMYEGEKEIEFWAKCPTVWDDTKVLGGEIGEYISIARRSGDDWFVGTMNSTEPRKVSISLDFLDKSKKYTATLYYDDPTLTTRSKVGIKQIKVTSKSKLDIDLLASGGHSILISER